MFKNKLSHIIFFVALKNYYFLLFFFDEKNISYNMIKDKLCFSDSYILVYHVKYKRIFIIKNYLYLYEWEVGVFTVRF
jgi:hypothetical protein